MERNTYGESCSLQNDQPSHISLTAKQGLMDIRTPLGISAIEIGSWSDLEDFRGARTLRICSHIASILWFLCSTLAQLCWKMCKITSHHTPSYNTGMNTPEQKNLLDTVPFKKNKNETFHVQNT
ncbi:uncharacterized protein LOC123677394 isoform X2 [Harmonia axyridis]|uniref:uncharacterized protein LOC123677394 isoform X2 n=1 Tax=Harmonia axyridis TaxID=115357 RepID=UPI001E275131|nr:uncharacterized protein LOC123677394 isoform X2 [Harmonia axyridis]